MKDSNEFIKNLVKIEYQKTIEAYGHYPFQMYVEFNNGKKQLVSLALGGNIRAVYGKVRKIYGKTKKIFLSVDFPTNGDIESDFVVVYSVIDKIITSQAITYDTKTGKTLEVLGVVSSKQLTIITNQFKALITI